MNGIGMKELEELLSHGHEAEFTYHDSNYVIQPELADGKTMLVIWDCSPAGKCICSVDIPEHGDIPATSIECILNKKCFSGKSFMEIESEITVDVIF
ncbi:MAG: hypothetical protein Q4B70_08180 [Lachnospiraceae bacterium]|nr:hypothetical protein [Lachnospiraceae bacterium]